MRIDKENNIIYFDNDEEFYDFCVETYSINRRVRDHRVRKAGWDFSDWYQSNVNEVTKIVILDSNSTILRRGGMVTGRAGITRKINAYRVNPIDPENPELLMVVGEEWIREIQYMYDDEGLKETERSSKMSQVKTIENIVTEDKFDFNNCIKKLESSTMFYMSLGSKELFHSNFLHWLSMIDMDYFLKVIHSLSGVTDSFWWEDPKKYKIDVRREDKNFDLSIWALDNCKDKKNEKEEKWIPVLVLENKMKSLPYREQLEKYVDKAFNIWKSGDNIVNVKSEIDELKKNQNSNWDTQYSITFILLSLLEPTNIKELEGPIKKSVTYGKRPNVKSTPSVSFNWICKDYKDLFDAIKNNTNTIKSNKCQQTISVIDIINDYSKFIKNLYNIANYDWKIIDESDGFIETVCPKKMDNKTTEYQRIEKLEELRIADIRDKIINDQLLHLVLGRLKKYGAKILQNGDVNNEDKIGSILCQTNYFHNVGLFEVIFMIKERDKGKKNAEPFYITIQVQGDTYMHGISGVNVVKTENKTNVIGDFWGTHSDWKKDLVFFFDFRDENDKKNDLRNDHFPQELRRNLKESGKNYKYDTNFIYQCSIIPEGMSIKDILDCIGKEVKIICDKLQNKVFQTMSVPLSPTSPT